jgi:ribosomal protein L25 (general stress protein Ctc)
MKDLKTNDEIVKILWHTIKEAMIYILKEDGDTFETCFRTDEYNGILEVKKHFDDSDMVPIDCYGSDNDGNEFELSEKQLDQLYDEVNEEGYYYVTPVIGLPYDQDAGFYDYS